MITTHLETIIKFRVGKQPDEMISGFSRIYVLKGEGLYVL
jgi:hypothetical protein